MAGDPVTFSLSQGLAGVACRLHSGRAKMAPGAPPAFSLVRGAAGIQLGNADEGSPPGSQPGPARRMRCGRARWPRVSGLLA